MANYKVIQQNFYTDPVWTWQRTCILSLFLLCAGMGQAIAVAQGQTWARFAKRWLQIALCAALVTAASMHMFPKSYIYFGVLHGLCVMLIVARLAAPLGQRLWWIGGTLLATWLIATHAMNTWTEGSIAFRNAAQTLNATPWNALGLITAKPITEDYVPLLPWLAVVLFGVALGQRVLSTQPGALQTLGRAKPLAVLGRWGLSFYMLHQPVFIFTLVLLGIAPFGP